MIEAVLSVMLILFVREEENHPIVQILDTQSTEQCVSMYKFIKPIFEEENPSHKLYGFCITNSKVPSEPMKFISGSTPRETYEEGDERALKLILGGIKE